MSGLNLIPNEVVGYRILAEERNWTVAIVKKKGATSKDAGAEYATPLGHCKNIESCVSFIVRHAAQDEGEVLQTEALAEKNVAASAEALVEAFKRAEAKALESVAELIKRMEEVGATNPGIVRRVINEMKKTTDLVEEEEVVAG